jgi:hypothetical protein
MSGASVSTAPIAATIPMPFKNALGPMRPLGENSRLAMMSLPDYGLSHAKSAVILAKHKQKPLKGRRSNLYINAV